MIDKSYPFDNAFTKGQAAYLQLFDPVFGPYPDPGVVDGAINDGHMRASMPARPAYAKGDLIILKNTINDLGINILLQVQRG